MFDLDELAAVDPHADEAALVARIDELERVKSAAAAGQARAAAALDERRRADDAAAGVPAAQRGRGVTSEIGLARRDSPARGSRYLSVAKTLVHDMPHTLAALECGALSEWRATLIVRETAGLSVEDRALLDVELCADVSTLDGLGDKRISAAAKAIAHRLDAQAVRDRAVKAEGDRRVTIRPAPDAMTYVTALSPASGRYPLPRPGRGGVCGAEPHCRGDAIDLPRAGMRVHQNQRRPHRPGARCAAPARGLLGAGRPVGLGSRRPVHDNDLSAFNGKTRPGFEAMLDAMKRGEFNALICWHPDRPYRSMRDLERLIDIADAGGVSLRTVNGGDLDLANSSGRMLARILGSVARQESEHKGERQKRANQQRRAAGKWVRAGLRKFGYDHDGQPIEPEASALRQAAEDVLTGKSLRGIAMDWNNRGFTTTRGNAFTSMQLRRTLINPL